MGETGVGLNISAINHSIALASFSHIHIGGFEYSLVLYANDDGGIGFVNGNHFYDMRFSNICHGITLMATNGGGVGDNKFFGVDMDPLESGTLVGIDIINGGSNCFYGYMAWDWNVCPTAGMVNISNESSNNRIELVSGSSSNVNDLGEYNIISYDDGGSSIPYGTGYTVYKNLNFDTAYYQPYYAVDEYGCLYYDHTDPAVLIGVLDGNNATVHLSGETYEITNWLLSINNFTLVGDNKYNTILHPYADVTTSVYAICAMYGGGDNVNFRDITFDADQHREYVFHNSQTRKYNWNFEDCIFKGANQTELIYYNMVSDSKFIDCDFYGKIVYLYNCTNITFERCNFYSSTTDALEIYNCDDVHVLNCKFDNYADDGIYIYYSSECLIANNHFECPSGDVSILISNTNNCTITNNFVYSSTGIDETGTSDYNIISCNNCGKCTTPIDVNGAHTIHFNSNIGTVS